jgi:hypothetical protein
MLDTPVIQSVVDVAVLFGGNTTELVIIHFA